MFGCLTVCLSVCLFASVRDGSVAIMAHKSTGRTGTGLALLIIGDFRVSDLTTVVRMMAVMVMMCRATLVMPPQFPSHRASCATLVTLVCRLLHGAASNQPHHHQYSRLDGSIRASRWLHGLAQQLQRAAELHNSRNAPLDGFSFVLWFSLSFSPLSFLFFFFFLFPPSPLLCVLRKNARN